MTAKKCIKKRDTRAELLFCLTKAILVSQNNETAAMLVSQTNPVGVGFFSLIMQKLSFVPINLHRWWPREWKRSIAFMSFSLTSPSFLLKLPIIWWSLKQIIALMFVCPNDQCQSILYWIKYTYLSGSLKTNLAKFTANWLVKGQKAGFLCPIRPKITLTEEKERKKERGTRGRRREKM